LVMGNDIPGFSLGWCRGDLDMVSTELSMGYNLSGGSAGFGPPTTGRYAPFYKLAREHARSRFVNVWLYNDRYTNELARTELCNVLYSEMLATHTLPKFAPASDRIAGNPTVNAGFFEFVEQVAPQFGGRVPVEDVGVYYSSSTILRRYTPGGFQDLNNQSHQFAFWGWATALGELHSQYRAVPEWKLTSDLLATLRLLVIPNADVLDPADVPLLTSWVNAGGRLIITGDSGKYLGEAGNFALNTNGLSIALLTNHASVVYLPDNIGMAYYQAYTNRPALISQFETAVLSALTGTDSGMLAETTAHSTAGITLYQDEAAGKLFIDINNLNIDTNSWQISATDPLDVELVLPEWMQGASLQVSVVSPQANLPSVSSSAVSSNRLTVSLGAVNEYAGVIIASEWGVWREAHFSAEEIKTGIADAEQDPDADGFTNRQEYIAGTDPKDGGSVLRLLGGISTGTPEISFNTQTGRLYSLYARTNLLAGEWAPVGSPFPGSGQPFSAVDTNGLLQRFYRLTVDLH
jgi:hypothetical protein